MTCHGMVSRRRLTQSEVHSHIGRILERLDWDSMEGGVSESQRRFMRTVQRAGSDRQSEVGMEELLRVASALGRSHRPSLLPRRRHARGACMLSTRPASVNRPSRPVSASIS